MNARNTSNEQKEVTSKRDIRVGEGSAVIPVDSTVFMAETNEISVSPLENHNKRFAQSSPKETNKTISQRETQSMTYQLDNRRKTGQQLHDCITGKHFIAVGVVLLSILVVIAFILDCIRHQPMTEEEWLFRTKEILQSQFLDRFPEGR
jgi:preprotein translocase subunit SecF